jgi:outer membrane protein assembly factor BamB
MALGIDLDREGNVYVAGESDRMIPFLVDEVAESRALVAKFSRSGTLLWTRYLPIRSDGYVGASDVAASPDGALYVAGGRSAGSYDGVLWKLVSRSGAVVWKRVIDSGENDTLVSVAVRPGGGEICGVGGIADYTSAFIACYSPAGAQLWQQTYPSPAPGIAIAESVALTQDGSTYVTGAVTSAGAGEIDLWVAQYR